MASVLVEYVALAGERPEDERWRPDMHALNILTTSLKYRQSGRNELSRNFVAEKI
jgi:hypothetical protein